MENIIADDNKKEISSFEKIINLTKLGSLCLAADRIDKSIEILQKTLTFYEEKINTKEIPNFFYSILYSNLAKAYSVKKEFGLAEPLYTKAILNHPLYKLLIKSAEEISKIYLIDIEKILEINPKLDLSLVEKQYGLVYDFFKNNSLFHFTEKYKPNNLNSISSFTDSLINLAVIYQIHHKETNTAFNMYCLAILIEPNNEVANIDFNNYLRELNFKHLSDKYIVQRISYDSNKERENNNENQFNELNINFEHANIGERNCLSVVCMKWGTKYGADYVNKLYRGFKKNMTKDFQFFCITDNTEGLDSEIKTLQLDCEFKGWMKKSILFNKKYTNHFSRKIMFIDLDMIIVNNLDYLYNYDGDFCLMKTDDIQCEHSKDGYNSSIILWRNGFGQQIYNVLVKYHKYIIKQIIRFDHYLEFIVKNSDFSQDIFPNKILDYNFYCKGKDILPSECSIVAFPRSPKPHECSEDWVKQNWV